ncbi:alpha/beta-hydrolase [Lentinula lateritia]|uniref:Alpha/beta-hydrolase n=1 Tax=Lentinula aff. lateritia TaxID=2804960 RepID=A0ACC1TWZ6_9AGAR|nr:alpha/beta-hydrolase [Lentinula aff. lateritia]KAJ3852723.1 alpha/beta-hydrolase [Lentinula lateritia]
MLNLPGLLLLLLSSASQARSQRLPSTFPHNYTGIPKGDFSPAWQKYFEVTDPLPNVTEPIARNFAGNIGVNRVGHPNNTLWFWAFEKEEGSLTARPGERDDEPWLIWLNGGPGSSSLVGLMTENGPLQVTGNYSIVENEFSWNKLADAFWVDQPVGTGFSTSDAAGYVDGEDQLGQDFVGFLTNLVKVFPSLATRPFYLTGESYAGTFIMLIPKPYITKAIFSTPNPPVNLRKISIGDGTIGGFALYEELSTVITLETYPEIIGFDPDVFQYFKEQYVFICSLTFLDLAEQEFREHLCGYDVNLTYPQHGIIPTITDPFTTTSVFLNSQVQLKVPRKRSLSKRALSVALSSLASRDIESGTAELEERGTILKRNLIGRPNGTLDPTYGCFLWEEMTDYAQNFTFPWTVGEFDAYDIPDALRPEVPSDPSVFLNDNRTRAALHAPIKEWVEIFSNPFGNSTSEGPGTNPFGDPSVEPMAFMTELATNASDRGVHIIIYEGNDDSLVAHRGLQVVIQNITFGGIQGFTRKPATPFTDDEGRFAGIVHQERNLTYALFQNAGHFVPMSVPEAAFVFLREFILGSNTTGLVVESHVVGGEDPVLAEDVMPGTTAIFYGHGTTASSLIVPSATLASWSSFLATATATSL